MKAARGCLGFFSKRLCYGLKNLAIAESTIGIPSRNLETSARISSESNSVLEQYRSWNALFMISCCERLKELAHIAADLDTIVTQTQRRHARHGRGGIHQPVIVCGVILT